MQKAKDFIWVRHVSDPSIPSRIDQTVAETDNAVKDDHHWIWWMYGNNHERYDVTQRRNDRYSTLPKRHLDLIVDCCSQHVADERREKNERDNSSCQMIVISNLVILQSAMLEDCCLWPGLIQAVENNKA